MSVPLIKEEFIYAPVEKIWKALTDTEQMKHWYFDMQDFKLETGHEFRFYEPGENRKFLHLCKILEIVPNHKFSHTWTYPDYSDGVSVVTWQLIPEDEHKTKVILTHVNLKAFEGAGKDFALENYEAGWDEIVGTSLKKFVEEKAD